MTTHENIDFTCPYKRLNHFSEFLNQFIIHENSPEIPAKLIGDIHTELLKQRIMSVHDIQHKHMKMILRKLGHINMYEHIPYIISKISGKHPVSLTQEQVENLKLMFEQIQKPFEQCKHLIHEHRTSFFSYDYVFYKLCELLELHHILQHLSLIKSQMKLLAQDKAWKGICDINKWQFIPSTNAYHELIEQTEQAEIIPFEPIIEISI